MKIDLHIHSTASDGKYTPKQLVDMALNKKISAISITDHDTISGVNEAIEYSKNKNVKVIPGIEVTITPPKDCKELHMVGLFINLEDKEIRDLPKRHRKYTEGVVKKIIKKLNDLGYQITFEELLKETSGDHLGRPFIAKILMRRYPKEFESTKEVFNKLLGKQGKAFVKAKGTSMKKAIEIIHNAGGITIIAHPWFLGDNMEKVIKQFIKMGGDGIERDYKLREDTPLDMGERLDKLIKDNNLIVSGGTDFHEDKEGESGMGDYGLSVGGFEMLMKGLSGCEGR